MKLLRTVYNYLCFCGIEKEEYNKLKKDAYVSNFRLWRVVHCLMFAAFAFLYISSLFAGITSINRTVYLAGLIYSAVVACLFFFVLKKDSIIAQLIIYLSISVLFLLGAFISEKWPDMPAATFVVFLVITPMFMIDKPYFMAFELTAASVIYLVWMRGVKSDTAWNMDLINTVTYGLVGIFLHIIANSIRIKEFVLTRKINIQKDTDDLTGLKNKGAVTREINAFLNDDAKSKGIMMLLDIDSFKSINDTYGHDVGDTVINKFGVFLGSVFTNGEISGRFGGDEFIVFIKDTDDISAAEDAVRKVINGASKIMLPDESRRISVSAGVSVYRGEEKNYSEIFKKADVALYNAKSDPNAKFSFYGGNA